jgi:hypothetical protein
MEQQIMTCWNICEDLDTLHEGVLERAMTHDRISNALMGMKELYQLKFEKLWEQFEAMLDQKREDKFHKLWSESETTYTNYDRDDDNMNSAHGEVL